MHGFWENGIPQRQRTWEGKVLSSSSFAAGVAKKKRRKIGGRLRVSSSQRADLQWVYPTAKKREKQREEGMWEAGKRRIPRNREGEGRGTSVEEKEARLQSR